MRIATAVLVCSVLQCAMASAKDIEVQSQIDAVTVFSYGAEITRRTHVNLEPGEHTIFVHIPDAAIPSSIRVEGHSTGKLEIGSVDTKTVTLTSTDPSISQSARKQIEDEIEKQTDERSAIDDVIKSAQLQQSYLENLAQTPKNNPFSPNASSAPVQPDWAALFSLIGERSAAILKTMAEAHLKQREIDRTIKDLKVKLAETAGKGERRIEVRVNVLAHDALQGEFVVRYQINNASWTPLYDARLVSGVGDDLKAANLTLVRRANISQSTGEDWTDVKLSLSTTQPQGRTAAPEIHMMNVDFMPDAQSAASASEQDSAGGASFRKGSPVPPAQYYDANGRPMIRGFDSAGLGAHDISQGNTLENAAIRQRDAQSFVSTFQAIYDIPGRTSIAANSQAKRITIASEQIDPSLYVKSVPRLSTSTYLYAQFALAKTSSPMLPGQVYLFRDGVFVGSGYLPQLSPGENHDLGFGLDERVKVKFSPASDKSSDSGTFTKSHIIERSYAVSVQNLHATSLLVKIIDRKPISKQEAIKVEFAMTAGSQPVEEDIDSRRGLLRWDLNLKSGEEQKINYTYKVTAPADKKLQFQDMTAAEIDKTQYIRFGAAERF